MTVGELAGRMGTTVRTLQYYDRKGLLPPSSESEGGRRLYTERDMVRLHQILSMKSLGFSLDDIKNRLSALDTPVQVAEALAGQADAVREELRRLSASLGEIEALRAEVLQMRTVDFKRYADIIVNLRMKNEYYWLIKHFDDPTLDRIRGRFDMDSGLAMMEKFRRLTGEAAHLEERGAPPDGGEGREFAERFWRMVLEFTDGDPDVLRQLVKLGDYGAPGAEGGRRQAPGIAFIGQALAAYFTLLGLDPLEEGMK